MLLVDTVAGRVISDEACKEAYAARKPYGEWLDAHLVTLDSTCPCPTSRVPQYTKDGARQAV